MIFAIDEREKWQKEFRNGKPCDSVWLGRHRKNRGKSDWRSTRELEMICEYIIYLEGKVMSEWKYEKGRMKPITEDYNELAERLVKDKSDYYNTKLEAIMDDPYHYGLNKINGKLYEEVIDRSEYDTQEFCHLNTLSDGTIEFEAQYHNGGCCLTEMIDSQIRKNSK